MGLPVLWFGILTDGDASSLKAKGLDISAHGVSIKTEKRFDREHYVDATQRCVGIYASAPLPLNSSSVITSGVL